MNKKINRLTIILEPLEKYFKQDGYVTFWKECKEHYRNQAEENNIQSLSINNKEFNLQYAEQFENGWEFITLTLEKYYKKKLVEKLNWILKERKLVTNPTEAEKKEYSNKIQKLEDLANTQDTKSFGIDLLHIMRKLYMLDENKTTTDNNESYKFLIAEEKYSSDNIETIYRGLLRLELIKCSLSDFSKLFSQSKELANKSKANIKPINWLKNKTTFGYVFSQIVKSFQVEGFDLDKDKISHKLWLFADEYFIFKGQKVEWSIKKEKDKPGVLKKEIDEIFKKI